MSFGGIGLVRAGVRQPWRLAEHKFTDIHDAALTTAPTSLSGFAAALRLKK